MTRRSVDVPGLHHAGLPIPQASRVGPLLLSGGINGMDPVDGTVPDSVEVQVELVFANIERVMAKAGGDIEHIARCTFHVVDRTVRPVIDAAWVQMFPDPASRPARHTLVSALQTPLLVQCEITAYIEDPS